MARSRYLKPSWLTRTFNRVPQGFARLGISIRGAQILAVRGRKSGELRTIPVNVLAFADRRYLVSPRGETHWVRNLRVSRSGELRLGKRHESFRVTELGDADKPPMLRAYLSKWRLEVGIFFPGVTPRASEEEFRRIASGYPVFRIEPM
jgi:hypothetical protein